jgi:hypothetical protein
MGHPELKEQFGETAGPTLKIEGEDALRVFLTWDGERVRSYGQFLEKSGG